MGKITVKVKLHAKKPLRFLPLCEQISTKHSNDGANSKLNNIDMTDFETKRVDAAAKWALGKSLDGEAQSLTGKAYKKLGMYLGQKATDKGTVRYYVSSAVKTLKRVNRENPEEMENWGLNVVVTSKQGHVYVRVEIPNGKPDALITLAQSIYAKHVAEGANSPLDATEMTDMDSLTTEAAADLTSARTKTGASQATYEAAYNIMGFGAGQNSRTTGTLHWYLIEIRDTLLDVFDDNPEELNKWGFRVVVRTVRLPKSDDQPPPTV